MKNFAIECPHCQAKLQSSDELIGAEVKCPVCETAFVVTAPAAPEEKDAGKASPPNDRSQTMDFAPRKPAPPPEGILAAKRAAMENRPPRKDVPPPAPRSANLFIKLFLVLIAGLLAALIVQMYLLNRNVEILTNLSKPKPITAFRLIDYTWELSYSMQKEFKDAIEAGYEPAGYVCQNSIKGGFFLFVKREK